MASEALYQFDEEDDHDGKAKCSPPERTILLVEDNGSVRRVLERLLKALGYRVLLAIDGQQALALCGPRGDGIDLVLTDLVIPKIDGRGLCLELYVRNANLPIVGMTGYEPPDEADCTLWQALSGFLKKPIDLDDLEQMLASILDG